MNLPSALLPQFAHWLTLLAMLGALRLAWSHLPWRRLRSGNAQCHLLFAFSLVLALAWSMNAGVKPGLNLHLLGAMAATLALGAPLALYAFALALVLLAANGALEWQALPVNFLLMGLIPILLSHALRRLVERYLPAHFFVFIFILSFFGSALIVMLEGLLASLLLAGVGAYELATLTSEYLPYFLLLGFAEAWLSGALITLLVVYKPDWVLAFDDQRYLVGK